MSAKRRRLAVLSGRRNNPPTDSPKTWRGVGSQITPDVPMWDLCGQAAACGLVTLLTNPIFSSQTAQTCACRRSYGHGFATLLMGQFMPVWAADLGNMFDVQMLADPCASGALREWTARSARPSAGSFPCEHRVQAFKEPMRQGRVNMKCPDVPVRIAHLKGQSSAVRLSPTGCGSVS